MESADNVRSTISKTSILNRKNLRWFYKVFYKNVQYHESVYSALPFGAVSVSSDPDSDQ